MLQWEFQVGPCECIATGDHLWIATGFLDLNCHFHDTCIIYIFQLQFQGGHGVGSGYCHGRPFVDSDGFLLFQTDNFVINFTFGMTNRSLCFAVQSR